MDAGGRWQILRLHVEDQVPLAALARHHGLGVRTLERWHARYRAGGLAALDRTPRADVGGHRLPAELVTLIEGLGLTRPRPPIAAIHRTVVKVCAGADWPVPSYGVVRSIITALDPGMVTLALEGPGSYRDKYELAVRRAADRPNAMWQADHTLLDIVLVGTDGKPARPWLKVVMDDCSRAICGYMVFFGAPATMNTALALRQAIWHKSDPRWPMCGIPEVLYVDHGSDFTSDHLARTTVDLHIRLIHSAVARPQGRGKVERFFGTVNTELLTTLPGHLHHGAGRWPAPALSLADLDGVVGAFVLDYNDRTHSELGISPRAAWIADGWLPRTPDSLQALDGLLLSVARSRTVRRDGVHFQGLRYVSPTLAGFVGRPVVIRYDPRDITEIRVFDHDQFLCAAVDQDHHGRQISLKEVQAARNARRRALRRGINERIAMVGAHTTDPRARPLPPRTPASGPVKLKVYKEDLR
ncbi:Mu transposase C-terminal domain-containing protein [Nostocoides veronense]|uniref:DDE-type integrase/transposase/recombinase n=1 Tax=Nostocoides veronense TaxID=330836 RepID=A0ABP4Y5C5_9MICO